MSKEPVKSTCPFCGDVFIAKDAKVMLWRHARHVHMQHMAVVEGHAL